VLRRAGFAVALPDPLGIVSNVNYFVRSASIILAGFSPYVLVLDFPFIEGGGSASRFEGGF
jgi:hypothetical protein